MSSLLRQRFSRVYLDEVGGAADQSIGIVTVKLVISPEESAAEQARSLMYKVRQEIADEVQARGLLQLIETIIVYKLPNKSREEVEAMFGLSDLKQTKLYQEALQEGKLQAVPHMLALGASVEQIAEALSLDIEQVRQVEASRTQNDKSTREV